MTRLHLRVEKTSLPTDGPAFESPCSRRGCAHIFKYAGTNPFEALAALVAQHAPDCTGRIYGVTHKWDSVWVPSDQILDRFYEPVDDSAMYENFGHWQSFATDPMDDGTESDSQDQYCDSAEEDMDVDLNDIPVESISAPIKRKARATRTRSMQASRTKVIATAAATAPPVLALAPRKKKGARTEAQRKALLEADPWIRPGTVAPHHVGCLGCKHTIKLDGRSRYYPGLWEKHRLRCAGVNMDKGCTAGGQNSDDESELSECPAIEQPVASTSKSIPPPQSHYRASASTRL
ncbi:hypothetical protein MVEN_00301500 [Mycena venus]|uniref:Uncharacterized protein n=1 Tax=Mycena venus TaxID=2733690 RepID=A0A8H7DCU2_9AGAR|nr:hypothetical protein MVEN_00301500 [Mycena venus]